MIGAPTKGYPLPGKGDRVRVKFGAAEHVEGEVLEVGTARGCEPFAWVRVSPQWVHRCDLADLEVIAPRRAAVKRRRVGHGTWRAWVATALLVLLWAMTLDHVLGESTEFMDAGHVACPASEPASQGATT